MDDGILSDRVQSVLKECSYLVIKSQELSIKNGSQIGVGGSGEVLSAKLCKSGQGEVDVAVKCVWAIGTLGDRQRFVMRFARELQVWAAARHLNVLPLIGFYLSNNYEIAQLVSPYLANGNVTQYISRRRSTWNERLKLVKDVAAGVAFLHNHQPQICHGDLKPANILVSSNCEATLCDFGLASFVETSDTSSGLTTSRSIKGSARYMSPELLLETDGKHTLASDVWAWACTAFEIVTGRIPYFEAKKEPNIIVALHRGEVPGDASLITKVKEEEFDRFPSLGSWGSGPLQSSVPRCWSFFPAERPTMGEIMDQVFPRRWEGQLLSHADVIGQAHARIKAFINLKDLFVEMPALWICLKLNGVCHSSSCWDTAKDRSNLPERYIDIEVDVDVHNFREVILLEAKYSVDGIEKQTLGTDEIGVMELARETSVSRQHHYMIQNPDCQITLQYSIAFSHSLPLTAISQEQIEEPANRAFWRRRPSGDGTQRPPKTLVLAPPPPTGFITGPSLEDLFQVPPPLKGLTRAPNPPTGFITVPLGNLFPVPPPPPKGFTRAPNPLKSFVRGPHPPRTSAGSNSTPRSSGGTRSSSSDRTYYSAHSRLSSDSEIAIPGGYR